MADDDKRVEVDTTDARAGATPGIARYVLAISMILVIAIFLLLLWRPFG